MIGLGLSINSIVSGSAAVVIEDYLWSSVTAGEITPRFAAMNAANVVDNNDAWDVSGADLMPAVNANPNYLSDDEGYWVAIKKGNVAYNVATHDTLVGQDGDQDSELTPVAISNIPIGDGNYV